VSLTPEQRRRIRAEEEARVAAEEEARYRAAVRSELAGQAPTPAPPTAPARARVKTSKAPMLWGALAGVCLLGAMVLVFVATRPRAADGPAGDERPTDVELRLVAGGAIAPVARPAWRPESLATDTYTIDADGKVKRAPGAGLMTLDELRAAYAAPAPIMEDPFPEPERASLPELIEAYRASPPDTSRPRLRTLAPVRDIVKTPDKLATALDDLLRFVPPSAYLVVGLDRAGVTRSPMLAQVHAALARALGSTPPLSLVGGEIALAAADRVVYAAAVPGVDAEDEFLVVASADGEHLRTARDALAGRVRVEGAVVHYDLGSDGGVVVEDGRIAAARPRTLATTLAARATDCITWSGAASAMVRRVRDASALFIVIDPRAAGTSGLDALAPGLEAARMLGARVDVGAGVTLALHLDFADAPAATTALAGLERRRTELAASPAGEMLARIRAAIDGARLSLTLDLSEVELGSLLRDAGLR